MPTPRELLGRLRRSPRALGLCAVVAVLLAAAVLDVPARLSELAPAGTPTSSPTSPPTARPAASVTADPGELTPVADGGSVELDACTPGSAVLARCGPAPALSRGTWLNHDGDLSLADLRGSVVLVDIFSGSNLASRRELRHVKAWQQTYASSGLQVVGVHTPEFDVERDTGLLARTLKNLSITFPVLQDDSATTMAAYRTDARPSTYLIDRSGDVRAVTLGEFGYFRIEGQIRKLLVEDLPDATLPDPAPVPEVEEPGFGTTRQIDLVDARGTRYDTESDSVTADGTRFRLPPTQPDGTFSFGGPWTFAGRAAVPGTNAETRVRFRSRTAFQVVSGTGTLIVTDSSGTTRRVPVDSDDPDIVPVRAAGSFGPETLTVRYEGDLKVFAFSFG